MAKRNFGKDYKTPRELVTLLKNRGLIINDRQKAQLYLESIGYYRLSAYMHPLLKTPKTLHQYKEGATFSKVVMLYRFDKKLRVSIIYSLFAVIGIFQPIFQGCQITSRSITAPVKTIGEVARGVFAI